MGNHAGRYFGLGVPDYITIETEVDSTIIRGKNRIVSYASAGGEIPWSNMISPKLWGKKIRQTAIGRKRVVSSPESPR